MRSSAFLMIVAATASLSAQPLPLPSVAECGWFMDFKHHVPMWFDEHAHGSTSGTQQIGQDPEDYWQFEDGPIDGQDIHDYLDSSGHTRDYHDSCL